jgi:hypothetical protein
MSGGLPAIDISAQGINEVPHLLGHRTLEVTAGGIEEYQNSTWTQFETNKLRLVGPLDLILGSV